MINTKLFPAVSHRWQTAVMQLAAVAVVWGSLATACMAQARLAVEAFAGEPFGVGRMFFQADRGAEGASAPDSATLSERGGRVFYPAYVSQPVRQLLRSLVSAPQRSSVYFLFVGNEPLDLAMYSPGAYERRIRPAQDRRAHDEMMRAWWRAYTSSSPRWGQSSDRPALVETYLTTTLARRLDFELSPDASASNDEGRSALELLAGTEGLRTRTAQQILLRTPAVEQPTVNLPEPLPLAPLASGNKDAAVGNVAIEPIASHVPAECFYMRFGSFPNYLWFRHRLDAWGGDVRNLTSERAVDYQLNQKLERQLALHETALAKLLGERVIQDVAVIGTDTFMREGAAMGILFHARDTISLRADITRQRIEALRTEVGASEKKIRLAGREVSLISTPDNRLRSFYAADGDFHFVTTSRALAQRFLEAGRGSAALAASSDFRRARSRVRLSNADTVFIYLSPDFMRNLAGPHYRIESLRRLRSTVEIESVLLARLAARGEGQPGSSIDELVAADMLPARFGQRSDGSRLVFEGGEVYDSQRGRRGTFVPVPDVPIRGVTPSEARAYQRFSDYYDRELESFDPVLVTIKRSQVNKDLERVVVDVEAGPLGARTQQRLGRWLGPASDRRLARVPGDQVSGQVSISRDNPLGGGDHTLFLGLRDADPAVDSRPTGILGFLAPRDVHGYIGAYPEPGLLGLLGAGANLPSDAGGFSQILGGIWRRQYEQFTLLSFRPQMLEQVAPQLHFEPAPAPAQLWLHSEDLAGTRLGDSINRLGYRYARGIAQGNIRFLHSLAEQLHVPRASCMEIAELLLDARLVSPIGGHYELRRTRGGLAEWVVVRPRPKDDVEGQRADDYQFPAVTWLRGLEAEARLTDNQLVAHVEAVMPAEPQSTFSLPAMPSFSLPGLFGGGAKPATKTDKPATAPPAKPNKPAPRDVPQELPEP